MTVIVGLVSQKGGVGKSSVSRALAVVAAKADWKVRIADLDPEQSTSKNWNDRRKDHKHEPVLDVRSYNRVEEALKFSGDVDLLILDGPARTNMGTLAIANLAHLVVQPSNGHIDDLDPAIKAFHDLVGEGIPKDKLCIALSRMGTAAEVTRAREYIAAAGYECLDGALFDKPAYGQAQDMGQAIIETRFGSLNEQADKLIESLLDAVIAQSSENGSDAVKVSAA